MPTGRCHCGAVRYTVAGEPEHAALCHCSDCTRAAGAQMVGWALFPREAVTVFGSPVEYRSSEHGRRQFCGTCGTGLFYTSEAAFPGKIDIQIATLDEPEAYPATAHIQVAEDPAWMKGEHDLPRFERYPG